jgi:hypothetical protein
MKLAWLAAMCGALVLGAGRTTISLDGEWRMAESLAAGPIPGAFPHRAPVPGLANLAEPPFKDVDRFDSREFIDASIREKKLPPSARVNEAGVSRQERNYFWYQRTVKITAPRGWAMLRVNKAQFGTAVWVNGQRIGDHLGCFSAGIFDVTKALKAGENEIVIRIGAHPNVLPSWAPAGTDFEKYKWTPGIYDSVSLALGDGPFIESVQAAPRLGDSSVSLEATLKNPGAASVKDSVRFSIPGAAPPVVAPAAVKPGETVKVRATLRIPNAKLWTPETPNLYTLTAATAGDSLEARFGMREFRFDSATKRAYLNGKLYFLRGSNITLHRFFEDPNCKRLPWDRAWVKKLLAELPKKMNWNSFRFCIGPAPGFWFDIADEAGLLVQNEFFIWNGRERFPPYSEKELTEQYSEWMRDHWNHPSVAIWDATNETDAPILRDVVIPRVRQLDLSGRPWENGYATPSGPDDPVEDHPYLFSALYSGREFDITQLERMTGAKTTNAGHPSAHAVIANEYGWLWLRRDGTPTLLTERVYEKLLGKDATPQQRFELYAYYLAGLTEFWRAHRNFAGVLHFTWLTCDYPGVKTGDHWSDVATLTLEPNFADYVREAFKPLGVYINFWQPRLKLGERRTYAVMMVNDEPRAVKGKLSLSFVKDGMARASAVMDIAMNPHGAHTWQVFVEAPKEPGDYILRATALSEGREPTMSRRKVRVE